MKAKLLLTTLFCLALFIGKAQTFDYTETFSSYTGNGTFASSGTGLTFNWTATDTSNPTITLDNKNNGSVVSTSIPTTVSNLFIEVTAGSGSNSVVRVTVNGSVYNFTPAKGSMETLVVGNLNLASGFTVSIELFSGNKDIQINAMSWNTYDGISSIYDIQYTTIAGDGTYPSLVVGNSYSINGTVTAIKPGVGYYIQDIDGSLDGSSDASDWRGIYVSDATSNPAVLDNVSVTGKVAENNGRTELQNASAIVTGTGSAFNANLVSGALGEEDESVVSFITYSRYGSGAAGNYIMNIGFTTPVISIEVDNDLFSIATTPVASNHYAVSGPVNFASSTFRISPRDISDYTDEGIATINNPDQTTTSRILSIQSNIIIEASSTYSLQVYNLAGQKVKTFTGTEGRTEIGMEKGVYIVKLNTANSTITEKVLVK